MQIGTKSNKRNKIGSTKIMTKKTTNGLIINTPRESLVTLKRTGIIPKLSSIPRMGPYAVVTAHDNGNVTIPKEPFLTDRVNI